MSPDQIGRLAAELRLGGHRSADDELEAVRTAILVEDVVGVTLRDEEILPGLLGGAAALERLALPRERGIH